jgi:asparagine synthase (glutamine-hydrolysing)
MSKLAGIFYFDFRPTTAEDEARVCAALEGPEQRSLRMYRGHGLVMGHAATVADSSRDNGRCVSSDGFICTWDGRLDNRADLLSELQFDCPHEASDSDCALQAYRNRGTSGFYDLIGDWSAAVWDEQTRTVVLASDYAGIRPLYYHHGRDRLLWSSCLSDLVRWTGLNELDEDYVASFLTQGSAANRTPYQGLHPVPSGYAVCASKDRIVRRAFWDPPYHRETKFKDERCYEERLKGLFQQAVSVRLAKRGPSCAELSGGLDSSSIVCMASQLTAPGSASRPDLMTFSYTHESMKEERYFQEVERFCNCSGIHLQLEDYPFASANQVGNAAPSWWQPRFRELSRRMAKLDSSVLLTGQFGDFLMGNTVDDSDQVADYLQNAQFLQAAREAFSWSQSLRVPIYSILWRALRTNYSSWAAPSIAQSTCDRYGRIDSLASDFRKRVALSDSDRDPELRWQAAPPGRRRRFRMMSDMLSARVLQVPEALQHTSYTHPYAHRPLVEFMMTIPASVVCRPGEPRRLMRRTFAGLLPPAILRRKSKGAYHTAYRQALIPLASELLKRPADIRLVEYRYVDRNSFTDRLTRFAQGLDCNESQLRQLILFEFWLRGSGGTGVREMDETALSWIN